MTLGPTVAIDTETTGLHPHRDRLCLVQMKGLDDTCHLVHFPPWPSATATRRRPTFDAPNLKALLEDPGVVKLFHYARFDVAMLRRWLGADCAPSTAPRSPRGWCAPTPTATA